MNFRQYFISNQWWGKCLGAFFGYFLGGPIGAFWGLLIGNLFDRGLAEHFSKNQWIYLKEKRKTVQKIFFSSTFAVMGYIAKADGHVSKEEVLTAATIMKEMHLNREQKTLAERAFNEGKTAQFDLAKTLTLLQEACQTNPELIKLFLDIQYRAAQTDGLSEKKLHALNVLLRRMGYAPLHKQYRFYEDFGFHARESSSQQSKNQRSQSSHQYNNNQAAHDRLAQAYQLLDINKTASKQEVKRAYRQLISRNHPDKLIAKGLSEDLIKIATEKTQKIRKAYEEICASKGW